MGDCRYCRRPAGPFRSKHKACESAYTNAWTEMTSLAAASASGVGEMGTLEQALSRIGTPAHHSPANVRKALVAGWERAVESFLEDSLLTADEEARLVAFAKCLHLEQSELDGKGALTRVHRAAIIREVLEGRIPESPAVRGDLPFNLQKSESLVYLFQGVPYYEMRTRTHYEGGYSGVSVRIMKGVYYRAGGFRGRPVQTTHTVHAGTGILGLTTKHLYFHASVKSFRVPYAKIVSVEPYSDGVGIQRDAASAKPQIFMTGDGWFTYNLLVNLARI